MKHLRIIGASLWAFPFVFALGVWAKIYYDHRAANALADVAKPVVAQPASVCPPDARAEAAAVRAELTALRNAVELTIATKPEPGKLRAAVNALAVYLPAK
jgi:hypothetical protein